MDLTTLLYFILYLTLSLLFFSFIGYAFFKLTQNWQSSRKLEEQNEKNELSTTTLTSKFSTLLTGWLNDEVINSYLDLIVERSKHGAISVYAFNTFFYQKLCQSGYIGVQRWTRNVNIFDYQMLLIPIHLGNHWSMVVVDFERQCIDYYDSMLGENLECMDVLRNYLMEESLAKKGHQLDMAEWRLSFRKDIPYQENLSDCGVFACTFAEHASRRAPITFNQSHIPYFREKMLYDLNMGKLF